MFLPPPLLLHFSLFQRGVRERRGGEEGERGWGRGEDGKRIARAITYEYRVRGDPNVSWRHRGPTLFFSGRVSLLFLDFFLFHIFHAAFHRKGEDDKEADREKEGGRGGARMEDQEK